MNERKQPSPSSENDEADPPSIAADTADSTIVFSGDPEEVSAGFALALRLLGIDAPKAASHPGDPPKRKQ